MAESLHGRVRVSVKPGLWTGPWTVSTHEDSTIYAFLTTCLSVALSGFTARLHSVSKTWQYTERSKVTGILIDLCFNSAAAGGGIWSA